MAKVSKPEVKERAADSYSATARLKQKARLRELREDESALPWRRWIAQNMVARNWGNADLAEAIDITEQHVGRMLFSSSKTPNPGTVDRLEELFGFTPTDVALALRQERSEKAGGSRKWQRRNKGKVAKWKRQRLETELRSMFGGSIPQEIRDEITKKFDWHKPLGLPGYKLFMKAKATVARQGLSGPLHEIRKPQTGPRIKTPAGRLSQISSGLQRRQTSSFYQCQNCDKYWQLNTSAKRGELCGPCWRTHLKAYNSWQMTRMRNGADADTQAPQIPRGVGRRVDPEELQKRIIALLSYRLGRLDPTPVGTDRQELNRTEKHMRESTHPWFQRVSKLLDDLLNTA